MAFGDVSLERLIAGIIALLVGLTFHEFSHALLADHLGDHRPRAMGRLTLNPIPHIDPIGALMLVVAGFGWAKPVMVNPAALRGGRQGMALVAFAGPIANVVVAVAFAIVYRVMALVGAGLSNEEIATRLELADGEPAVVRRRLRFVDGQPYNTNDSYFPHAIVAGSEIARPGEAPRRASEQLPPRKFALPESHC